MPMSDHVARIRSRTGHDLLLLPSVGPAVSGRWGGRCVRRPRLRDDLPERGPGGPCASTRARRSAWAVGRPDPSRRLRLVGPHPLRRLSRARVVPGARPALQVVGVEKSGPGREQLQLRVSCHELLARVEDLTGVSPIRGDETDTHRRTPVQVLGPDLGDGYLVPPAQLGHQRAHHRPLLLQRVDVPEQQVELAPADDHRRPPPAGPARPWPRSTPRRRAPGEPGTRRSTPRTVRRAPSHGPRRSR